MLGCCRRVWVRMTEEGRPRADSAALVASASVTRLGAEVGEVELKRDQDRRMSSSSRTGATPRLSAVRLSSADRPQAFSLSDGVGGVTSPISPTGKSPRQPGEPPGEATGKVARLSSNSDAASASRDVSRHVSIDDASHEAIMAAAFATGDDDDLDDSSKRPGYLEEKDDESSEDEEASLSRMMRLRQQKASPGAHLKPRTSPRKSSTPPTPAAAVGTSGASATSTPAGTSGIAGGEEGEGGYAVVGSGRRRQSRTAPDTATTSPPTTPSAPVSTPPALAAAAGSSAAGAGAAGSGAKGGGAGDEDSSGDELHSAYSAAKDASRRKIGKQSRSVKQAVHRQYSVEARMAQAAASGGR